MIVTDVIYHYLTITGIVREVVVSMLALPEDRAVRASWLPLRPSARLSSSL